ncbi:ATP-binding protein [Desulfothermus sp.]
MSLKVFPATLESLLDIKEYILCQIEDMEVDENKKMKIILAVEELIVNIVNYSNMKKPEIAIEVKKKLYKLIIKIIDEGKPFNPLEVEDPDISLSPEERKIGGLGIFLVKQVVDEIYYKREENKNCVLLVFNLTSPSSNGSK